MQRSIKCRPLANANKTAVSTTAATNRVVPSGE